MQIKTLPNILKKPSIDKYSAKPISNEKNNTLVQYNFVLKELLTLLNIICIKAWKYFSQIQKSSFQPLN